MNLNKYLKSLEGYGVSKKNFDKKKKELSKRFKKDASDNDVIWSFFNELILKTSGDLHKLKIICGLDTQGKLLENSREYDSKKVNVKEAVKFMEDYDENTYQDIITELCFFERDYLEKGKTFEDLIKNEEKFQEEDKEFKKILKIKRKP
jgi:hypothetical protein